MYQKIINLFTFGKKDLNVGVPLGTDRQWAFQYFYRVYDQSGRYVKGIVEELNLNEKKIVSLGSGFGAEEILFSKLGNGEVDCIEPDKFSCDVSLHFMQKMGVENMKIHNIPFQSFEGDKKFDLIYASSPSDWMRRDFREIVPEKYMHFFNQFSSDKSFIVINFYGGEYSYYLLRSAWFLNSLMNKFEEESNFRLLEYIISNSGNHASAILSNFKFEIKNDNFLKLFSKRQGEDSVVNFKIDKFGIPKISKFESTIFPYLALVKKIRLEIAKKIKRILTSRTGK